MTPEIDITIPIMDAPNDTRMPLDRAVTLASALLGLPQLGGPSGRGWSFIKIAMKCPHLFKQLYRTASIGDRRTTAAMEIGGLFHTLLALTYGSEMGLCCYRDRGLIKSDLIKTTFSYDSMTQFSYEAPDRLLVELKAMCVRAEAYHKPELGPNLALILEAERLYDAHTNFYGHGNEDLEPLAVEWLARHPKLNYTCRFDLVAKVGPSDPHMPEGIFIIEHKSAKWLSDQVRSGWTLDGEILGQLLCWEASGCAEIFGPLVGLCVDVVTKAKIPDFYRLVLPPKLPPVSRYARWIAQLNAEIATWEATDIFPQRFSSCFDQYGACSEFQNCEQLSWRS